LLCRTSLPAPWGDSPGHPLSCQPLVFGTDSVAPDATLAQIYLLSACDCVAGDILDLRFLSLHPGPFKVKPNSPCRAMSNFAVQTCPCCALPSLFGGPLGSSRALSQRPEVNPLGQLAQHRCQQLEIRSSYSSLSKVGSGVHEPGKASQRLPSLQAMSPCRGEEYAPRSPG
jgi:hypothetical protein